MSFVNEKSNSSNLTRHYKRDNLSTNPEVIKWISDLKTIRGVSISYLLLSDLLNRSDEGSDNTQIPGDAKYEVIEKMVKDKNVDLISAYGSFDGKPVVIGANINSYELFITIRKNNKANIAFLEKVLALK